MTALTALEAALAVADELGLAVDTPEVLAEGFNLVVHLAPSPIVARVPILIDRREEARTGLERDLAVSAHAAARGAPVVAPAAVVDPGPHARAGWMVGLFEYVRHERGGVSDPEGLGASLRAVHESLATYTGAIPSFAPLAEPVRLLMRAGESDDARFLRGLVPSLEAPEVTGQTLHGDASFRNVLVTPDGPRWLDFDTAAQGPVEWDLAEVVTAVRAFRRPPDEGPRALAAYGPHDADLLEQLVDLRAFQHACFIVWYEHRHGRTGGAGELVEWLRRRR